MYTMAHAIDRIGILYVDDEETSLKYFTESFEDIAPIYTAGSATKGLEVFRENQDKIGIVLSDKKMPGVSGIEFLEKIRKIDDQPLRILVTAYSDLNQAVESLNDGLLYSYLTKPWDPSELETRLKKALDRFWITRERNKLLKERAVAFQEMLMAEKATSIGVLSSGLNHHMRNALTVIQAFIDMIPMQLEEELNGKPRDHFFWNDYYEKVEEQIGRMISILSNLAEEAGEKDIQNPVLRIRDNIDLIDLVRVSGQNALEGQSAIGLNITAEEPLPALSADFEKVSRMTTRLIEEALNNTDAKGVIEIKVFPSQIESSGADAVTLQFIDDGDLIPENERSRLFDPFLVRSSCPGKVGVDLVSCYLVAFQHGGSLKAEALNNARNMIELTLPLAPVAPAGGEIFTRLIEDTIKSTNPTSAS